MNPPSTPVWYRTGPHSRRIDAVEVLGESPHSLLVTDGWEGNRGKTVRKQTSWETYWPDYASAREHLIKELTEERDRAKSTALQAELALVDLITATAPPAPPRRVKLPARGDLKL